MMQKTNQKIINWLLAGDPSVRWQVERDLLKENESSYQQTRSLISQKGWGRKLLAEQDPDGTWGGGLYSPKWISTHYTLICLRRLGLDPSNPQAQKGCQHYLDKTFYELDGGINCHKSYQYSETCVTGMTLNFLSYFKLPDPRLEDMVTFLLDQQMPDGGWNCESFKGATHSSVHTTISVLEGLLTYQKNLRDDTQITTARERAHEFLLQHRLYQSHRTGETIDARMTRFPFPPRWYYDILRALDYFQAANTKHDQRFEDAIEILQKKQKQELTWPQYRGMSGRVYFDLEPAGKPGRMNTLRALRVLTWWKNPL
jgi:hypothetical protein